MILSKIAKKITWLFAVPALFAVIVGFLLAPKAYAALAVNSTMPSQTGSSANNANLTYSFTNTAGTLLVVCADAASSAQSVTGVTYAGTSMTKITSIRNHSNTEAQVSLWYLLNPATGANNVVVTKSGSASGNYIISGAMSFTGNDTSSPIVQSSSTNDGSVFSTTSEITLTGTTSGDYVVDCADNGTSMGSAVNTLSWKKNVNSGAAGNNAASSYVSSSGGSVLTGFTGNGSDYWAIAAAEIKASGASIPPDATSASTTINSDGARSGDTITITGSNFGTVATSSAATCNGGAGTGCIKFIVGGTDIVPSSSISSWTNTAITFTVPATLNSNGGASALQVWAANASDTTPLTFYIYPNITGIASVGTNAARTYNASDTDGLVMLSGDHFGTSGTSSILGVLATQYNSTGGSCNVGGYTTTSACFEVPSTINSSTYSGNIILTRGSDSKQATTSLYIMPRITSVTPTSTYTGQLVQVLGDHLCGPSGTCPTSTAAGSLSVALQNHGNSWVAGFETNCNINACPSPETITIPGGNSGNSFTVSAQDDLVVFGVWCRDSCTVSDLSVDSSPSVSIASGDIVQTTAQGSASDVYGQARMYYVADAPAQLVGTHTLSLTVTGGTPPSGQTNVQYQLWYMDFSISAGYHFIHDLDSAYATGTGSTVNAPSVTAPGDLLVAFEDPDGHTISENSPWTAVTWPPDFFQSNTNSSNGVAYIASAGAGSTAANFSVQYGIPSWGSMITAFTPTSTPTWSTSSNNVKFGNTTTTTFVAQTGGGGACNGSGAAWAQGEICLDLPSLSAGSASSTVTTNNYLSNSFSFTATSASVPGTPGTPAASNVGSSTLTESWSAASGVVNYYTLQRDTSPIFSAPTSLATTTATTTNDSGRSANTTYYYRVKATNSNGDSAWSASSSVLTLPNMVTPTATFSNISTSTLTVNWTALAGGAAWYVIKRSTSPAFTSPTTLATTSATSANDSGLSANTTYYYEIIGANTTGNGVASATSSVTTTASAPPSAPTVNSPASGIQNASTTPIFIVSSTDSSGGGLQYKITFYTDNSCGTPSGTSFNQNTSQTGWSNQNTSSSKEYTSGSDATFTIPAGSALSVNTTYYWAATAIDPEGSNTWSSNSSCYSFSTTSGKWTTDAGSWAISSSQLTVAAPPAGTTVQIHVTGISQSSYIIEFQAKKSGGGGLSEYRDSVSGGTATALLAGQLSVSKSSVLSGSSIGFTASSTGSDMFIFDDAAAYTGTTISMSGLQGGDSWSVRTHAGAVVSCQTGSSWNLSSYSGQVPIDYDNGGGTVAVWTNGACTGTPDETYPPSGSATDIMGGDSYSYTPSSGSGSSTSATTIIQTSTITINSVGTVSY